MRKSDFDTMLEENKDFLKDMDLTFIYRPGFGFAEVNSEKKANGPDIIIRMYFSPDQFEYFISSVRWNFQKGCQVTDYQWVNKVKKAKEILVP